MAPPTNPKDATQPPFVGKTINGSVWDSVNRSPVRFQDLDLNFSHEDDLLKEIADEGAEEREAEARFLKSKKRKLDEVETQETKKVRRNGMLQPRRDEIIWDISKAPERWHPAEPDLKKEFVP